MAEIQKLVKGEVDWHEKINQNFEAMNKDIGGGGEEGGSLTDRVSTLETAKAAQDKTNEKLTEDISGKLSKAPKQPQGLQEGYVYQNQDGTSELREAEAPDDKFKYTIIVQNGGDGNPALVEYADDCQSFLEAHGSDLGDWGNTKLYQEYFKPCVIDAGDGAPRYYLQKDNMSKQEDGSPAVTTGADGDVMIQVKKLYGKFTKSGSRIKISIANYKEDSSWMCFTEIDGEELDVAYRGAFKAGIVGTASTVMRSVSGVAPLVSQTRATMRQYAKNRGDKYHQNNFYLLLLWQIMYLMMYKNKDSQTVLGQGRTASGNTAAAATGSTLTKPFCWGDQGGVNSVKFLGVEDFFGNVWEWVDGVCLINKVYKATRYPSKYNDDGTGYEISANSGLSAAVDNDKYIVTVQGTNDLGFLPASTGGSSTTHWCDNTWVADATQVVSFGGYWSSAAIAGAFAWALTHAPSHLGAPFGSRLCRK